MTELRWEDVAGVATSVVNRSNDKIPAKRWYWWAIWVGSAVFSGSFLYMRSTDQHVNTSDAIVLALSAITLAAGLLGLLAASGPFRGMSGGMIVTVACGVAVSLAAFVLGIAEQTYVSHNWFRVTAASLLPIVATSLVLFGGLVRLARDTRGWRRAMVATAAVVWIPLSVFGLGLLTLYVGCSGGGCRL